METAGNFGALKKEIHELREGISKLKTRMDAAEIRSGENEDPEIAMTQVLIHSLRLQKQLEGKLWRHGSKNLRIYSVPEKSEGNNIIEFMENLIWEKLGVNGQVHIERAH